MAGKPYDYSSNRVFVYNLNKGKNFKRVMKGIRKNIRKNRFQKPKNERLLKSKEITLLQLRRKKKVLQFYTRNDNAYISAVSRNVDGSKTFETPKELFDKEKKKINVIRGSIPLGHDFQLRYDGDLWKEMNNLTLDKIKMAFDYVYKGIADKATQKDKADLGLHLQVLISFLSESYRNRWVLYKFERVLEHGEEIKDMFNELVEPHFNKWRYLTKLSRESYGKKKFTMKENKKLWMKKDTSLLIEGHDECEIASEKVLALKCLHRKADCDSKGKEAFDYGIEKKEQRKRGGGGMGRNGGGEKSGQSSSVGLNQKRKRGGVGMGRNDGGEKGGQNSSGGLKRKREGGGWAKYGGGGKNNERNWSGGPKRKKRKMGRQG